MVRQPITPTNQAVLPLGPTLLGLLRSEGLAGAYRGISAGILREMSYSTLRFGLYEPLRDAMNDTPEANAAVLGDGFSGAVRIAKRMFAGCAAGGIASAIASPTDLVKISMMRDQATPVPGLGHYLREIAARPNGPIKPFYEGVSATISRAVVLGATKMAVYNEIKDFLKRVPGHPDAAYRASAWQAYVPVLHSWKDSDWRAKGHATPPTALQRLSLVFNVAMAAGLAITCTTSPLTNARTHMMAHPGKYKSLPAALGGIVVDHGILRGLFRGFAAQWARFGPYALIQFLAWEQLRHLCGMPAI